LFYVELIFVAKVVCGREGGVGLGRAVKLGGWERSGVAEQVEWSAGLWT
jgi:hypothetical protein